jgi:flagellar hook-associated protein 1 FlgK
LANIGNLLGLARDAINAQGYALNVVGQNITNANTPGYVRRDAILQTRIAGTVTYGGVEAVGIDRSVDKFMQARTYDATSFDSGAKQRDQALSSIEALFNDAAGTGLSTSLDSLFSSFGQLAANPNDPTVRATVLDSADQFARNVKDVAQQIATQRNDILTQATATAKQVNDFASQVAKLNSQIALAEAGGNDASDLKDQRDKLVGQIAKNVNVHTFTDGSGKLVIAIGGSTLVEGDLASTVSIGLGGSGSMQISVARGATTADVTSQVTGGTLGGMREARDVDAVAVAQNLDNFAFDVATAINTQHAQGFGQDGVNGRNLFAVSGPAGAAITLALDPAMVGRPDRIGAASSAATLPGGGDNAVLLGQLANLKVATGSTRTATEAYSDLVGDVGQRKASAANDVQLRSAVLSQAQSMQDSVSGVSTDEEMISLSRFQRAYEAASKLVSTADELLANLIQQL